MQQKYKGNTQSSEKSALIKKSASEKSTASALKSAGNREIPTKQYNIERNYLKKVQLGSIIAEEISRRMEVKLNKSCE